MFYSIPSSLQKSSFYSVILCQDVRDSEVLAALVNSTFTNNLSREILSGAGYALGEGALWTAVYESKTLLILHPLALISSEHERLKKAFDEMSRRKIKCSVKAKIPQL